MHRLALSLMISVMSVAPAMAGCAVIPVPALGSPLPVAAAIGGVALVVRLLRRT